MRNLFQPYLNNIESHRYSSNFYWKTLIVLKDFIWFFYSKNISFHDYLRPIKDFFDRKNNKKYFYEEINSIQKNNYSISFCTTCMNRLGHLKKTLPQNIKDNSDYEKLQFVILDYSSNDKVENWLIKKFPEEVESGKIKIVREDGNEYFHMARSKNVAHYFADGEIVCNVDADNYVGKDFAKYLNYIANRNGSFVAARKTIRFDLDTLKLKKNRDPLRLYESGPDYGGRIAVFKKDFIKIGGYNEFFSNWGQDDNDFFLRCIRSEFNYEINPK